MDTLLDEPIKRRNGTYENPWKSWKGLPSSRSTFSFLKDRLSSNEKIPSEAVLNQTLPVETPVIDLLDNPPNDKIQYMWIGHATVLVQMNGINILTDPVFCNRCSPIPCMGPKRYRPPPCYIEDLPNIDAVVISHNHYDHMDYASVKQLNQRFGSKLSWFVPEGLKRWFTSCGCETVQELSWWQKGKLTDGDNSTEIICTPAQHWSLRNGFDRNKSLWCSWVVKSGDQKFFFSGDTGYCEAFKNIGKHYGPFNLAAIAIGAYGPRYFMECQHVDPEQAYQIHIDIEAKLSVGIHWGTFDMGSIEPYLEPKQLIEQLQKERQESQGKFITVNHGSINTAP